MPNKYFVTNYKFQPAEAIYVSTLVHTTAPMFGKIMAMTEPRHAVAYHFQNDPDTLPAVGRRCEIIPERPWHDQTPTTRIVAIGSPGQIDRERLKTLFERCIADRQLEETTGLPGVTTAGI